MKPDIWLVRHGPTEWSESGRHTEPHRRAVHRRRVGPRPRALAPAARRPRLRARAGEPGDAGARHRPARRVRRRRASIPTCASGTTATSKASRRPRSAARGPEWRRLDGVDRRDSRRRDARPRSAARARRVLARADAAGGDVLLFGHGHQLRILTAVALDLDPGAGARFMLDPATVSIIGSEHELRALRSGTAARTTRDARNRRSGHAP